ncbi:MAG: hypothetical protein QOD29_3254, partial [Alphaproteobacteria bacterium]|nr:hypothetical protein [Alphaproteobacteria bacterium]
MLAGAPTLAVPANISAGHCHQRYASQLPWEDSAMLSDLTELGQEAI